MLKMADTMLVMDYRLADILNADQLESDDLISIGEEIVKIISIVSIKDGFSLEIENEFGEKDIIEISDDEQFELYVRVA
jgi:hypothetical protein